MKELTPQQQAAEIFNKYIPYCMHVVTKDTINMAKKCSLIAVEEIIKAEIRSGVIRESNVNNPHSPKEVDAKGNERKRSYWQEVKEELENKK